MLHYEKKYTILNTPEYDEWLADQPMKSQVQIRGRVSKIREEGHFGEHKDFENGVSELKWKNGRRVYYAHIPESSILLLIGGNKNGQSKDIHLAEKILHKQVSFQ